MRLHPSITPDRLCELVERRNLTLDNPGICTHCGEEADGVEPDARKYLCDHCNTRNVYGAEELLLILF